MNAEAPKDDGDRIVKWVERFRFYRHPPDRKAIEDWLGRFKPDDQDLAARVLDAVQIVSEMEIQEGYKSSLESLPGWSRNRELRRGRWFFVGFGSPGESGLAMLRTFREAGNLSNSSWDSLFVTPRDLPRLRLSAYDSVVFVDDFSGSGKQVRDYWPLMQELVASEAQCYLILTAATSTAFETISRDTDLKLSVKIIIPESSNVFSEHCRDFSNAEKDALLEYGKKAWDKHPKGFGECGLLFVLSHKTPNNSVPILHINNNNWVGLFPRNLLVA